MLRRTCLRWTLLLLPLTLLLAACYPPNISSSSPLTAPAFIGAGTQQTGLWVNGEGKATFIPDIALLSLGIEAQEKTVAEAQRKAQEAMNKVFATLVSRKVAEKDIRTQYFSIQPVKQWVDATPVPGGVKLPPREVIVGYQVSNNVTAKLRKLEEAGSIINAVAEVGGDLIRISGISFTIDEPSPYRAQARELAMKDALAKAHQMASLIGVALGKPIYVTESGGYLPPSKSLLRAEAMAPAPSTIISPGEMELSVNVQIVFSLP